MSSSDGPKLPQDVAVEILKRLPVESLLRCRCVCRSWRSAIDGPRFVALHLSHFALDASNWYVVCVDWEDPVQYMCSLFSHESLLLPSKSQIEVPFATPPNGYELVGSCSGLICVSDASDYGYGARMYLWNIFTRNHKAVPQSGLENPIFSMETDSIVLGFGFDAGSHDCKIVRIVYFPDEYGRYFCGTKPVVEIYSLRADSWRSLECEVPALSSTVRSVFLNGNLHWLSFKFSLLGDEGGYGSIVLFDVAREMFDEMVLPEEISPVGGITLVMSLAVFNDLLTVLVSFNDAVVRSELYSVCSIWVMREYGVRASWTKLYSFEACGLVIGFDDFTRNGELMMVTAEGERVSWNAITGQHTNLPLPMCDVVNVVESLVSI